MDNVIKVRRVEWPDFSAQMRHKARDFKPIHEPEVKAGILAQLEEYRTHNHD